MPYQPVRTLPPAPQRGEDFQTFAEKANAHVAALTPWTEDVNAAGAYIETTAGEVAQNATDAETAAQSAGEDATQTAADRVATGEDRTAAANSAQSASDDATQTAADRVQTGEDRTATQQFRDEAQTARDEAQAIAVGDVAITDLQPGVWQPVSTSATLAANGWYAVDFTAGPLTLTLPSAPAVNDMIRLYKSAGDATDSIIARNGQTIMGLSEDLTLDYDITSLDLVFNGTDWRVVR